jgi:hypothetical protein
MVVPDKYNVKQNTPALDEGIITFDYRLKTINNQSASGQLNAPPLTINFPG